MIRQLGTVLLVASLSGAAVADYISGFDSLMGDADGVILTGQDGYYLPPDVVSTDFEVYTYSANALRLPQNPTGGTQFIAGIGQADGSYERAQRDYAFAPGRWTIGFDVAVTYTGVPPSAQNIGSVSTQPSASSEGFIALARWTDANDPTRWNADYVYYDAAGNQVTGSVPDAAFQNLAVNAWYRWETDFNFATHQIEEIRLIDIAGGTSWSYAPVDWYLNGGAGGGLALPGGFRFFAGSASAAGNTLAFDNMSIVPSPGTAVLLALAGLAARRRRA